MIPNTLRWFVPCASGDFRLEVLNDESCLLTVEDPTPADERRLRPFLVEARKLGWVDELAGISPKGRSEVVVKAAITEAGPFLSGVIYMPNTPLWLVVRQVNGEVSILDVEAKRLLDEAATKAKRKAEEAEARKRNEELKKKLDGYEAAEKEDTEAIRRAAELEKVKPATPAPAAATVQQPNRGCPAPLPANRRASEVLRAFSTPEQLAELAAYGRMRCIGNVSGRAYHVYHRDEAARRGLRHSLIECETQRDLCVWDIRVPAEEEMLALKLAVEKREAWLRSPVLLRQLE